MLKVAVTEQEEEDVVEDEEVVVVVVVTVVVDTARQPDTGNTGPYVSTKYNNKVQKRVHFKTSTTHTTTTIGKAADES